MRRVRTLLVAVALALFALPAAGQDWLNFSAITDRAGDLVVIVYDPDGVTTTTVDTPTGPVTTTTPGRYHRIAFTDLLAGLVEFDDGETRYLALLDDLTQPTCEASHFTGPTGESFEGQIAPVTFPATTFASAWICVAIPADVDLTYFTVGMVNSRNQLTTLLGRQGTATIGTEDYVTWVGHRRLISAIFGPGWFAFFSPNAVAPQP